MKRLRDESSSDFVRSLLDSAALDAPATGVEDRALRAAEREVLLPKTWPKGWVIGGTIVGVGALLLLLGQAYQGGKPAAAPAAPVVVPTVDSTPVAPPVPSATTPATPVSAAPVAPPVVSASAASPASAVVRPPSPTTTASGPVASASTANAPPLGLRDELALIDAARSSLAAGSAASALETLARYDARYPDGQLREEATAVRVEALFAAGRTAEARSVGDKFLREHPSSTHAQHVRSLLDAHAP